jgi:hypothetical protein
MAEQSYVNACEDRAYPTNNLGRRVKNEGIICEHLSFR